MWPLTIACGRCQAWVWPWRTGVPGLPPPRVAAPAAEPPYACTLRCSRSRQKLRGVNTGPRAASVTGELDQTCTELCHVRVR